MQFAVWPSFNRSWDETLSLARWAETRGLGGFWAADHLLVNGPDDSRPDDEVLECWTVLTAVGAVVPRVRLVSMVSPVSIHHPVVLAKRAITADHVSGGRAVLGIGAGWQGNEHLAYGFDLLPPGPRVSRFAEALAVVHGMVRNERVSVSGEFYRLDDVACRPRPMGHLPILIGSKGPRMARLTARYADEWNTWGDPVQLAERSALIDAACEADGRDPASLQRSAQALVFLVDTAVERERALAAATPGMALVGTADELIELLQQYAARGLFEFAVPDFNLGDSAGERRERLERLHTEVLAHVR